MATEQQSEEPRILILATLSGGYACADSVGQLHTTYATNTYVFPVKCPALFPKEFYLRTFEKGVDAIMIMYSGTDCPYKGGADRTAKIVNETYALMKERGIDPRRLRLVAMCTVCTQPFLKEVKQMIGVLQEIGPVLQELAVPRNQA
jgi:coenzyme F420-reducing hydrogenase delta subunit